MSADLLRTVGIMIEGEYMIKIKLGLQNYWWIQQDGTLVDTAGTTGINIGGNPFQQWPEVGLALYPGDTAGKHCM